MSERELLDAAGFVRSMVRPVHSGGDRVPLFSLSTLVLRSWDAQPIGQTDRDWQARGVRESPSRGAGVADSHEATGYRTGGGSH